MKCIIRKFAVLITGCFLILAVSSGCYAEPTEGDLQAVQKQFMVLRFIAPYSKKYKNLSDKEVFEISCKQKRVKCSKVMALLKKKDKSFFDKLKEEKK